MYHRITQSQVNKDLTHFYPLPKAEGYSFGVVRQSVSLSSVSPSITNFSGLYLRNYNYKNLHHET